MQSDESEWEELIGLTMREEEKSTSKITLNCMIWTCMWHVGFFI